ncbi:MAG TPA: Na+/H+ antiporter NhaA [Saprospiraceae bacterium]|nr:Na+/H+ antiporter NhaA [Lewinellaceae bacterium]HPK09661.1 Na+/H+ antiporter NhaA [Saprospiraceae bacterium]HPQ21760.1 Na+/H+ antiporter NhaA [Saprospiraceae bacterium]HRX28516.1 Na+/H+ antiporter NhaA [Saprospiraceae bacterium]
MTKFIEKYKTFLHKDSATGILLIIATAAALIIANSPLYDWYHRFMELQFTVGFSNFNLSYSLHHWVNDGLMALFFLLVGLEIKHELKFGRLQTLSSAIFPSLSALFGALVPAMIFYFFNKGSHYVHGWAIPMATDIAFVIGIIAMLGSRVPAWAKVFVTTIAVVDDLIAVLVIAFFYTDQINWVALGIAAALTGVLILFNHQKVNNLTPYMVVGFFLWWAVLASGIHSTIAGVIIALTIPLKREWTLDQIKEYGRNGLEVFAKIRETDLNSAYDYLEAGLREVESPLVRLERKLHGPVYHFVMPLFAFVNAGIVFNQEIAEQLFNINITWGILLGLLIGKPLGIMLGVWILVTFFYKDTPHTKAIWKVVFGIAILCGIGFTMSLFISNLSFNDEQTIEEAKISVLLASVISGILGYIYLRSATKNPELIQMEDPNTSNDSD